MIKEIKKYTDEEGKVVSALIPIEGSEEQIEFRGQVGIPTPMGTVPVDFEFPSDYTIKMCFENFKDIATEEVNKIMKEAEEKSRDENLIVTPGQASAMGQQIHFPRG